MQSRRIRRLGSIVARAAIESLENRSYLSGLQVNGIQQVNESIPPGNLTGHTLVSNDLHLIYDVTDDDGALTNVSVVWNTGDDPEDWMPGVDFDPVTGIPHGAFPATNTDQVYHAVLTFTGDRNRGIRRMIRPLCIRWTSSSPTRPRSVR